MATDTRCPECGAPITGEQAAAGVCPACMLELGLDQPETRSEIGEPVSPGTPEVRFLPGATVAGRYRVVSPLGRGGMGEVYRADDLKLGQPVALKFLHSARRDRIELLLREVKLARQVSHPNVCRVYDIGEIDGVHFLSMEYVDGEDLAALLRRVGHVPKDRAVRIARQLCAGLSAAHEQGILHRDLKPGNVMIDSRGRAKITDFGLAGFDTDEQGGAISGTPSYMAPEQAARGEVSVRSDLYSLGLVLHELFTGMRVFDAKTPAEMYRLQQSSTPPTPSSQIEGFDPAVERAIQRCLASSPSERPASALAVAAALPGVDALEDALAAGETPSPEVVAAAGAEPALRPVVALACLILALVGIGLAAGAAGQDSIYAHAGLEYPAPVLRVKAQEILEALGYTEPPVDEAWMFYTDFDQLYSIQENDPSIDRWDRLSEQRPSPMGFWYRRGSQPLVPLATVKRVYWGDPPRDRPGMLSMRLDSSGRLRFLSAVPDRFDPPGEDRGSESIDTLLEVAGLEAQALTPAEPEWTPPAYCDNRSAWTGTYPRQPAPEIRVEACFYRGRATYFEITHPWTREATAGIPSATREFRATQILFWCTAVALMVVAALMARKNLRSGRGDRRAAFRISAFVLATTYFDWLLGFHHVPSLRSELWHGITAFSFVLFLAFVVWLFYIALEPFARRVWPQLLISWSRLMAGRFRDPIIGRHVLFGALLGLFANLAFVLGAWIMERIGYVAPFPPGGIFNEGLHSVRRLVAAIVGGMGENLLFDPMQTLFLLVFLRFVLRGKLPALIGIGLVFSAYGIAETPFGLIGVVITAAAALASVFSFARFGLVGGMSFQLMFAMTDYFPVTLDTSAWYFPNGLLALLLPTGVVICAFWISLGGRSFFTEEHG